MAEVDIDNDGKDGGDCRSPDLNESSDEPADLLNSFPKGYDKNGQIKPKAISDWLKTVRLDTRKKPAQMVPEERVAFFFKELDFLVEGLNEKYDETSTKTIADWVSAYKSHMYNVYKQLKEIKGQVQHEKFEMRKHKRIAALTEKVSWFEHETQHYKAQFQKKAQEAKDAKNNEANLADDAYVLRKCLMNSKVKNKALKAQLEQVQNQNTLLAQQLTKANLKIAETRVEYQTKLTKVTSSVGGNPGGATIGDDMASGYTASMNTSLPQRRDQITPRLGSHDRVQSTTQQEETCTALVHVPDIDDDTTAELQKTAPMKEVEETDVNTGVRRFIYELLDNQETFTREQIIDQIEMFIEVKSEKCNTLVRKYFDRMKKAEGEARKTKLHNHQIQGQSAKLKTVFEQCLEQVKADKFTQDQKNIYEGGYVRSSSRNQRDTFGNSISTNAHKLKRFQDPNSSDIVLSNSQVFSQSAASVKGSNKGSDINIPYDKLHFSNKGQPINVQIKPHERRGLINKFLNNEEVLGFLHDSMFNPSNGTITTEQLDKQRKKRDNKKSAQLTSNANLEFLQRNISPKATVAEQIASHQDVQIEPHQIDSSTFNTFQIVSNQNKQIVIGDFKAAEKRKGGFFVTAQQQQDRHSEDEMSENNPMMQLAADEAELFPEDEVDPNKRYTRQMYQLIDMEEEQLRRQNVQNGNSKIVLTKSQKGSYDMNNTEDHLSPLKPVIEVRENLCQRTSHMIQIPTSKSSRSNQAAQMRMRPKSSNPSGSRVVALQNTQNNGGLRRTASGGLDSTLNENDIIQESNVASVLDNQNKVNAHQQINEESFQFEQGNIMTRKLSQGHVSTEEEIYEEAGHVTNVGVTSYQGAVRKLHHHQTYMPKPSLIKGHSDFTEGFAVLDARPTHKRPSERQIAQSSGTNLSRQNVNSSRHHRAQTITQQFQTGQRFMNRNSTANSTLQQTMYRQPTSTSRDKQFTNAQSKLSCTMTNNATLHQQGINPQAHYEMKQHTRPMTAKYQTAALKTIQPGNLFGGRNGSTLAGTTGTSSSTARRKPSNVQVGPGGFGVVQMALRQQSAHMNRKPPRNQQQQRLQSARLQPRFYSNNLASVPQTAKHQQQPTQIVSSTNIMPFSEDQNQRKTVTHKRNHSNLQTH